MKKNYILAAALCLSMTVTAQQTIKVRVLNTANRPVEGAIVGVEGNAKKTVLTDEKGYFELSLDDHSIITVKAKGYYAQDIPASYLRKMAAKHGFLITVVPESEVHYSDRALTIENKDFNEKQHVGGVIGDAIPGLQVIEKSGVPGEGAYLNARGVHSLVAENNPLIVINGVPYLSNQLTSSVIDGYSRDMLFGYDPKDIRSVTLLKGADAAAWGSLGSNGVLLIETEKANSTNLDTRISFSGSYGMNFAKTTIPLLDASQYRNYMSDLGLTRYSSMAALVEDYPFLQNGSYNSSYLFNENTDWMKEISKKGFVTENLFRVEGGDEIAKYNISFGYTSNAGTLKNLKTDKYHTLISADVLVSRKIDIVANVGLAYINSNLQNFGMNAVTNPILAASYAMPIISPYKKQTDGSLLSSYSTYDGWNTNANPTYAYDNVSNPLALVEDVAGADKIYDANTNLVLNYHWNEYLKLSAMVNLYYNYIEESMFVPGVTSHAVMPQYYGYGKNYVAQGVTRQHSNTYQLRADYNRVFNHVHELKSYFTARMFTHSLEYDISSGYNTANDYYQTLDKTTDEKNTVGDNIEWNYLGFTLHGDYTYNRILRASANVAADATSASGTDASRLAIFPSGGITFLAANTGVLPTWIDKLNVSLDASLSGNSRFSSNYGKNYYTTSNFFSIGAIKRSNVPNTKLTWEKNRQLDLALDFGMLGNRINLGVNLFSNYAYDLLLNSNISKVYGSTYYYENSGEISGKGVEVSLRVNPVHTHDFDVVLGATLSTVKNTLKKLGESSFEEIKFSDYNGDDAEVIMQVGSNPYEFYGYQTNGIYTTTAEAQEAKLTNASGKSYEAGDVRFVDQNHDGVINSYDKVSIGKATPDIYGGVNLMLRYRQVSLDANFGYCVGNKAYNATRRLLESMSAFYNQSTAVLNRWQVEGQQTSIPRAAYGDPSGNNIFSDRWIEDASYFKLRSLKLAYTFGKVFSFVRSGNVYVAAENLFTITKYTGTDPEFAYCYAACMRGFDYGKLAQPVTVKLGFNLNF
jgi:TonB-linked SusC/RagA family outer membrane protein